MLWTLLIFIGCFTPSYEIPKVDVPFADKWTHLVLFGVFSFLWLGAKAPRNLLRAAIVMLLITAGLGGIIEIFQGVFTSLGRSMELMDWYADTVGGVLGVSIFCLFAHLARKATKQ
jgi:VanZ family protein